MIGSVEAEWEEALDAFKLNVLKSISKVVPATVTKFSVDAVRGATVTAQPSRLLVDVATGATEKRAPIPHVPVIWPGFGGWEITGNLEAGQPILLLVADSEICGWLEGKATGSPSEIDAPHGMAGALAMPLGWTFGPGKMTAKPGAMSIGKRGAGETRLELDDGSIKLGGGVIQSPVAKGGDQNTAINTWAATVASALEALTGATGVHTTAAAALGTQLAAALSTQTTVE